MSLSPWITAYMVSTESILLRQSRSKMDSVLTMHTVCQSFLAGERSGPQRQRGCHEDYGSQLSVFFVKMRRVSQGINAVEFGWVDPVKGVQNLTEKNNKKDGKPILETSDCQTLHCRDGDDRSLLVP
eukprot:gene18141-biopygen5260